MGSPTLIPTRAQLARARYLGADAALAHIASLVMTDDEADRTLAGDLAWAVPPALSDDRSGGPTPDSVAREVVGAEAFTRLDPATASEAADALAEAWDAGCDLLWAAALHATALRTTGEIAAAVAVERRNEATTQRLRHDAAW